MFKYSSLYINLVSLLISCVIFLSLEIFLSNYNFITKKTAFKAGFKIENEIENIQTNLNILEKSTEDDNKNEEWSLEIPCINLKANIQQGTTKEIMEQAIGHFEETSKDKGNIGLAAHNRGYENNYFQNLKQLKEGDEIIYFYKGKMRKYNVTIHCIIKDTDWSFLEATQENKITLITCVENEPEYRRCIQGIEKIEESEESKT